MKKLNRNEIKWIVGGAGDNWDLTSVTIGSAATILRLPPPVGLAVGIVTEVAIKAAPHLPVSTPIPVLIGPSWNGSAGGAQWSGGRFEQAGPGRPGMSFCQLKGLPEGC